MTDVFLGTATRINLLDLQRNAEARLRTTNRLSTGLQVSRVTDDPVRFGQSQALTNRVSNLFDLKKGTGQALSAVETALKGTDAIEDLTQQLRGLATSARGATTEQRQVIAEQFDVIRSQIDALAGDVSYGGISLLDNPAGTLRQQVGDISQSEIAVAGQASDTSSLGISSATTTHNNFAIDADIDAALAGIDGAVSSLRSSASQFGSNVAALSIAEDFNQSLSETLQAGNDKLVNADLNEEAANLLSIGIRDQLGLQGLRIAQQSEAAIVQLLGGAG